MAQILRRVGSRSSGDMARVLRHLGSRDGDASSRITNRMCDFQEERDQEAVRRFQAVTYVALRVLVSGLLLGIAGRGIMFLGIEEAYAIYALGLFFMTCGFGLLSTCPAARVDVDQLLQKRACVRIGGGGGAAVNWLMLSLSPPHLHLVCVMLALATMTRQGVAGGRWAHFRATDTALWSSLMAFDFVAWIMVFLQLALRTSEGEFVEKCVVYTLCALFVPVRWLRMRHRNLSRTFIFYDTFYVWLFGHSIALLGRSLIVIVGVASTANEGEPEPVYQSTINGVIFLLFPSAIVVLGRKRLYSIAADHFDRDPRRKLRDGAFIAGLLDGATAVNSGQIWWVHLADGDKDWAHQPSDHRHHWRAGIVTNVGSFEFGVECVRGDTNSIERHSFPLARSDSRISQVMSVAQSGLRCMDWRLFSLQLITSGAGAGDFDLSRPVWINEVIDFFMSHSWHDDGVAKYGVLEDLAVDFRRRHGREPTFWLDKTCIDQDNIRDGLRVLPVNVMACKQVLVIWGATYPNRLWCIWELFTLVAFMSLDQAARCIRLAALGDGFGPQAVAESLESFDVKNAHCYDPNEEAQLHYVIDAVGAPHFNGKIHALGARFAAKLSARSAGSMQLLPFGGSARSTASKDSGRSMASMQVLLFGSFSSSSSVRSSAPQPAPAVIGDAKIPQQGPVGQCEEDVGEAATGTVEVMLPPFALQASSVSVNEFAAAHDQRGEDVGEQTHGLLQRRMTLENNVYILENRLWAGTGASFDEEEEVVIGFEWV